MEEREFVQEEQVEEVVVEEAAVEDPSTVKGMIALIAGISSFFITGIAGSIVSIIFGNMARNTAGAKMGKIGKVLGIINIIVYAASMALLAVFYVLYFILVIGFGIISQGM